jgi:acylphosphatase
MLKQAKLTISGKVQGVFFREFTQENAKILGLKGWVRNIPNSKVEAMVRGEEPQIHELIKRLNQGHSSANVTDLKVEWVSADNEFENFEVRY